MDVLWRRVIQFSWVIFTSIWIQNAIHYEKRKQCIEQHLGRVLKVADRARFARRRPRGCGRVSAGFADLALRRRVVRLKCVVCENLGWDQIQRKCNKATKQRIQQILLNTQPSHTATNNPARNTRQKIMYTKKQLRTNEVQPGSQAVHVVEPLTGEKRPPTQNEHSSVRCDGANLPFEHCSHAEAPWQWVITR
jgi:hypothetical protein